MLDILLQTINTSKLFNGISTIAMHIGGRYMTAEIPKNMENIFSKPFFRRLFIFFIIFLAFRDIKWAILITLIFILSFNYFLNEKSQMFIGNMFGYANTDNTDNNKKEPTNIITLEDLEKAKKIIKTYNDTLEKQKINI